MTEQKLIIYTTVRENLVVTEPEPARRPLIYV